MLKGTEKKVKSWVSTREKIDQKVKKLTIQADQLEEKCQAEIEKQASRFIKKAKHTDLLLNEPIHYAGASFDHIEFRTEHGFTEAVLFYVDDNDEKQYCSCPASVVVLPIIEKVKELYNE
mgnify:CR=1 FL=1